MNINNAYSDICIFWPLTPLPVLKTRFTLPTTLVTIPTVVTNILKKLAGDMLSNCTDEIFRRKHLEVSLSRSFA